MHGASKGSSCSRESKPESMYDELSKYGASMKKRILSFVNNALIYSGNQEKVFKWCGNLETHLFNHKW